MIMKNKTSPFFVNVKQLKFLLEITFVSKLIYT